MNRLLRVASSMSLLVAGIGLAGCGYNQSGSEKNRLEGGYHWNSLFREDLQTVAVPIFTNTTFRRGYEFRLTEAVIKQLEAHAPYKVVPRERADTILEGQITDVRVVTASRDYRTNLPREQLMTITLDLLWKDLRNGQILMQRKGLAHQAVYFSPLGEGEFVGSQETVEDMARVIVEQMQADW
jgi:hypothetical protein